MSTNLISVPQSGIKSINGVSAPAGNVDIISSDNSITVIPNSITRQVDITTGAAARTDIVEIASVSNLNVGDFSIIKMGIADKILLDGSYTPTLYGICIEKISSTIAVIQITGLIPPILSGLTDGAQYFADDNGGITTTPPTAPPGGQRWIINLGIAVGTTRFFLQNKQPILRNG